MSDAPKPGTLLGVNGLSRLRAHVAGLSAGKITLWCYLTWYLVAVALYFDPSPAIWFNSLGISAIVGFALLLSVSQSPSANPWQTARLFLMPFCVSSFSALIKGRGFFLIFPTNLHDLAILVGCCAVLLAVILAIKPTLGLR